MVRGLDKFKEHFKNFKGSYILIGGAACSVLMEASYIEFRATKDLDLILCVEAIENQFVQAFWEFIKNGKYSNKQKSDGKRIFYRFTEPENEDYPIMLELFSRVPENLKFEGYGRLTPIPFEEGASSLSAILLDEGYYEFLHAGRIELADLSLLSSEYLIPMKAKAYLDLIKRKAGGSLVDSRDIKKHKNDVLRLYRILQPDKKISVPANIKKDLQDFFIAIELDPVDLISLGYRNDNLNIIINKMREFYAINS